MAETILSFDGSIDKNPGPHGTWSWAIMRGLQIVDGQWGEYLAREPGILFGVNDFEYAGLLNGLETYAAVHLQPTDQLTVIGDSQLVIRHLTGEYRVLADNMRRHYFRAADVVSSIRGRGVPVCFEWVPRAGNHLADSLGRS